MSRCFHRQVSTAQVVDLRGQAFNLVLATWVSTINFWAWNLIGPLSTSYAERMSLSSTEASVLVATPILVGSLGRIVVGALTDRYGGRTMFIAISLASIAPVLAVGFAGAQRLVCVAAGLRVLPRHRGHDLRGRYSVREQLVRARSSGVRDRRIRNGHGRYRAVGLLHAAVRALVRADADACHHRGGTRPHRGAVHLRDAQLAGVHAEHRPGRAETGRRVETAGDLGDVVPIRRRVRWIRRVQQLPTHLHQDDLPLRRDRRRVPALRRSRSRPSSRARSVAPCRTGSRRSTSCSSPSPGPRRWP